MICSPCVVAADSKFAVALFLHCCRGARDADSRHDASARVRLAAARRHRRSAVAVPLLNSPRRISIDCRGAAAWCN